MTSLNTSRSLLFKASFLSIATVALGVSVTALAQDAAIDGAMAEPVVTSGDAMIVVADCAQATGALLDYCQADGIVSAWNRPQFSAALGSILGDNGGSMGQLSVVGTLVTVDGAEYLMAEGVEPSDPLTVYLNGIDLGFLADANIGGLNVISIDPNADAMSQDQDQDQDQAVMALGSADADLDEDADVADAKPEVEPETAPFVAPVVAPLPAEASAQTMDVSSQATAILTSETIDDLATCRQLASRPLDGGVALSDLDHETAVPVCERAARVLVNQPEVQFLHGRTLEAAGVQGAALDAYERASALGSGKADAALGRLYQATDLDARITLAMGALELGVFRDDPVAAYGLYTITEGTASDERIDWLKASVVGEHEPAILELARLAVENPSALDLTDDEVSALVGEAAERGHVASMSKLGREWIDQDDQDLRNQAIVYLRDAANQGDTQAASSLGLRLLSGDVQGEEDDSARALLEVAVRDNDPMVMSTLAAVILSEDGVGSDDARVLELMAGAALGGHAGSAANLGTFYRTGLLVPQDMTLSARWFLVSLALGNDDFVEQIYGYKPWDQRGRVGFYQAMKQHLAGLGLFDGEIDDQAGSALAKAVTRYIGEIDPVVEAEALVDQL